MDLRRLIEALVTEGKSDEAILAEAGAKHSRTDLERLREILRLVRIVLTPYTEDEQREQARQALDQMAEEQADEAVEAPEIAAAEQAEQAAAAQAAPEAAPAPAEAPPAPKPAAAKPKAAKPLAEPKAKPEPEPAKSHTVTVKIAESESYLLEAIEPEGKIIDVLVIKSGTSKNRKRYRPEVLRDATERGLFEGARSFASESADHYGARGVKALVGWWDNARYGTFDLPRGGKAEGVAAHLHPTDPGFRTTLVETMRGGRPDLIGFSIFGDGPLSRLPNGDLDVQRIDVIDSIDPVIHPAAGGQALRLVASEEPMEPTDGPTPDVSALVEAAIAPFRTAQLIESALSEREGLTTPVKARVRKLSEGKVLDAAAVAKLVEDEVEYAATLAPAPKPADAGATIVPGQSQDEKLVEAAYDLLTPGKPGSMRRFYEDLTGDRSMTGKTQSSGRLVESAIISSTFPQIMLDAMHKRMIEEYRLPGLDDWRKIVSTVGSVSDFKTYNRIRWGGYADLLTVAERGDYLTVAEPGDEKASFAITKRGGLEDLTLETIANDDLGQMRRIPVKLARAAKRTLYKFVFDVNLAANPTLYDAVALFHATHANLGSTALSTATLEVAVQALRDTTEQGSSEPLGLRPRYLLIPTELEKTAHVILDTTKVVGSAYNDVSWIATQGIVALVNPFWTDANNWFVVADPADAETIEIAFFNGREEPELFLQSEPTIGDNFLKDVLTYKIRHIYGGAVLDYRPFYGAVVA